MHVLCTNQVSVALHFFAGVLTSVSNISEIRSLVPKNTNIMALTATANLKTRATVIKALEMKGCCILSHNPNKLNLYYEVAPKPDIESAVCPTVSEKQTDIFCFAKRMEIPLRYTRH